MICKNCNSSTPDNGKFCENCGAPIAAPEAPSPEKMVAPAIQVQKKTSSVKWIVIAVVGVLIIAGISVGLYFKMQADKKVKQYSEQISLGEKYLEELKYDDAIIAFTKAMVIEPKKEKPYLALVDVYIETKDTEKANEIIAKIEKLFPENVDVVDKHKEVAVIVEEIKAEEEKKKVEEEKKKAEEEAAKKTKELRWLVEPTFEFDDIGIVGLEHEMKSNNYYGEFYAITAEQKGIINLDGKIIVPIGQVKGECIHGVYGEDETGNEVTFNSDGSKKQHGGHGGIIKWRYEPNLGHVFTQGAAAIAVQTPSKAMMVEIAPLKNQDNSSPTGTYLLVRTDGTVLTDTIYEDCYEVEMNQAGQGFACVKKNGKWGLVGDFGQEQIPFIYDHIYPSTNSIFAVKKDGKSGFVDVNNNVIVDFMLEETRPTYDGKAWVKYNGKWGVLDVTGDGSAVLPEATVTPEPEAEIPPEGLTEDQAVQLVKNYLALVSPEVKFSYRIQNEEENFMIKAFEDMGTHTTGEWYRVNKKTGELINETTGKTVN